MLVTPVVLHPRWQIKNPLQKTCLDMCPGVKKIIATYGQIRNSDDGLID